MSDEYFSPDSFSGIKHGPIKFGSKQGAVNYVIPEADTEHFSISCNNEQTAYIITDLDGVSTTVVDSQELDRGCSSPLELASFIADKFHEPKFIFGFDPSVLDRPDMWRLHSMGVKVQLDGVTKTHGARKGKPASGVKDVNINLLRGEFVGIYGESGSGKTTLIELLLGFWPPDEGVIMLDGCPPLEQQSVLGYLPQELGLPKNLSCRDVLQLAATDRGVSLDSDSPFKETLLDYVLDLSHFDRAQLDKRVGNLSGGQYRRLCLATVLLKPGLGLLIADEPTRGLDPINEREVMTALRRVSRTGVTVIIISHSVECCSYFDRVLILRRPAPGQPSCIAFDGKWDEKRICLQGACPRLKELLLHGSRIESLGYLMDPVSADGMPNALRTDVRLPQLQPSDKPAKTIDPPSSWKQFVAWTRASLTLHWHQRGGIWTVLAMSLACVLFMQLGCGQANGADDLALLFAITAPWLSATFATITGCKLLRYYAFESLTGLNPLAFVAGLFVSLLPVVFLIGLVFFGGMLIQLKKESMFHIIPEATRLWIVRHAVSPDAELPAPTSSVVIRPLDKLAALHDKLYPHPIEAPSYRKGVYGRAVMRIGWVFPCLCAAGAAIGLLAACLLRSERSGITFCVVIFMTFMVFSRAMIHEHGFMAPLTEISSFLHSPEPQKLLDSELELIVPIIGSFFSFGRYAFNLLAYYPDDNFWLVVECVYFGIVIVCSVLGGAFLLKDRNLVRRMLNRATS